MADDREKISTGPNEEPINETIAGTGPGIPDDALAPGEELPEPPTDEQRNDAMRKNDDVAEGENGEEPSHARYMGGHRRSRNKRRNIHARPLAVDARVYNGGDCGAGQGKDQHRP